MKIANSINDIVAAHDYLDRLIFQYMTCIN